MSRNVPDDEWMQFIADSSEPGKTEAAPSRLKARVYSALVQRQAESGPLMSLTEVKVGGRDLCVFEKLVQIAPTGEMVDSLNFCRVCQDLEEQLLLAPAPAPEDCRLHAALLSSAIASGEGLLLEGADAESLRPLRLTPEALQAKLESLRITYEQWHSELHPQRQAAVLREVFGGAV